MSEERAMYLNTTMLSIGEIERLKARPSNTPIICETYTCNQWADYSIMGSEAAPALAGHFCKDCIISLAKSLLEIEDIKAEVMPKRTRKVKKEEETEETEADG